MAMDMTTEPNRPTASADPSQPAVNLSSGPRALLGIFLTRNRAKRLWLLYGGIITYFTAAVLFYVLARYRLPVVPFLLPFLGAGLVELFGLVREGRRGELVCMVIALAALLYFVNMTAAVDTPTGRSSFFTRVGNAYLLEGERTKAAAHSEVTGGI